MAFLVGELLIELRVLQCLKVNEVTLMVNEVTPTESCIESRTVQIGMNSSAIIFLQNNIAKSI